MVSGILLALITGIQPVCTPTDFQEVFGEALSQDNAFVAKAIFDQYLDQIQLLEIQDNQNRTSPIEQITARENDTIQADILFDELLDSLAVLSERRSWDRHIIDLRRTVLLSARGFDNPWPATVWVDLPSMVPIDYEVANAIDTFLIHNIDEDRIERFSAIKAKLSGDFAACQSHEQSSMKRWGNYLQIISPYINDSVNAKLYPQLFHENRVQVTADWILSHIEDEDIIATTKNQLVIWKTVHNQQINDLISLIRKARIQLGFDPWSQGCGRRTSRSASKNKNDLLQKTAEIQEVNNSTVEAILKQLSPEQIQQLESD